MASSPHIFYQPYVGRNEWHQVMQYRCVMYRNYVIFEGNRYTRVSPAKYQYAILSRYTTMIKDITRNDEMYAKLHDLLDHGADPANFGFAVSWASTKELAERRAKRLRHRFADVTIRKARLGGEVYAVRYYRRNNCNDYEMVEPVNGRPIRTVPP